MHEATQNKMRMEMSELYHECGQYFREWKEAASCIRKQEDIATHFENQANTWKEESRLSFCRLLRGMMPNFCP